MVMAGTGRVVFNHWVLKTLENNTVYQMGADFVANYLNMLEFVPCKLPRKSNLIRRKLGFEIYPKMTVSDSKHNG